MARDPGKEPQPTTTATRWVVGTVLVVVIVVGCIAAGLWQLRRLDERRDVNARVRARSGETVPLPRGGFATDVDVDDLAFRRVRATGTFDADHEVLIRFRTRDGLPGYEVVTPLLTDGGALLVNRGWVPLEVGDDWPLATAVPPAGIVEVEGILVPPDRGDARLFVVEGDRGDRPPVAAAVDPGQLTSALPYDDVYALPLLARDDGGRSTFPAPVEPPGLGEGPHQSYAVQWFLFASVGVVGWIVLLRTRGPFGPRRPGFRGPGELREQRGGAGSRSCG